MYTIYLLKSRNNIKFNPLCLKNFFQELLHLTKKLFLQTFRKPSHFLTELIKLLFGALFVNIPLIYLNTINNYNTFSNCCTLIFTYFTRSLNTGLLLSLDREFGFLNRLIVELIISKNSVLFATVIFIISTTILQNLLIITYNLKLFINIVHTNRLYFTIAISLLVKIITSSTSLSLAFILPEHIELLVFIFIINLPILFTSTALAPPYFVPY